MLSETVIKGLTESAVYGVLGILLMALALIVIDLAMTRVKLQEELNKGNIAVGILFGAVILGTSLIAFGAIH